ncbi:MAG: hypothetical protein ACPGXL_10370 [Chitinophagales bacterium]
MRTLLICCLCFMFALVNSADCQAQLFGENQTQQRIWVAVAYHLHGDEMTWVSESWIGIDPGEKVELSYLGYDSSLGGGRSNFFVRAIQEGPNGKIWEGDRKFLLDSTVDPTAGGVAPDKFEKRVRAAHDRASIGRDRSLRFAQFAPGTLGGIDDGETKTIYFKQSDTWGTIEPGKFKEDSFN